MIKLVIYVSMICFGSWGLLSSVLPEISREILLGMIFPWSMFLLSVLITQIMHLKFSFNITKYLGIAMITKMILYGIIIVAIFSFMSFNPIPFIISFTGYYLMLHLTEAYIVRSFINNKQL